MLRTFLETYRPQVTLGLAVVAAILLVVSVLTKGWLANDGFGDLTIGPRGASGCIVKGVVVDIDQKGDVDRLRPRFKLPNDCRVDSFSNSELMTELKQAIDVWSSHGAMTLPYHVKKEEFLERLEGQTNSMFAPIGHVTFVFSLVLAAGLVVGAALPLIPTGTNRKRKRPPVITGRLGLILMISNLLVGGAFLVYKPGPKGFVTFAWGAWMFVGAMVLGIIALRMGDREA
jgi:hypothetical protein